MIQVEDLTKRFDDTAAVTGLSFAAPDGAITGLLGANGAGKTTTLRMIAGVLRPDGGRIRVGACSPQENNVAAQKHLGALLDHTGLYPRLSVRENLVYFARLRGLHEPQLGKAIDQVLSELGLHEIAERSAGGLSQGQRMKAALGRALIHRPSHLLLDEPINGLDVPTVRTLRRVLENRRSSGTCIVFSSHVLGEVEELCDRMVIVARGSVVAQGTKDELCDATDTASLEEAFIALSEVT